MIRRLTSPLVLLVAQTSVVFTLLFSMLGGTTRDLHVPLQFSHDALEYLMQVKGTIDDGWWWSNPHLSAPGTFDQVAYPSNTNVDQAVVRIVSLFTHDAPLCLNLSWMILVALSAPIATGCLRALAVSRPIAYAAGVLYALSPYALYRQIEHFALVVYLVPIACTAALLIATGRMGPIRSRTTGLLLAGCVLLGFDYIYYTFFGCFVVLVASLMRAAGDRDGLAIGRGAVFIAAMVVATVVNLTPTFSSWAAHGRPMAIPDKTAAESETYGLKIRQLVSPVFDHPLAAFRRWTADERRASYPIETENVKSRLGLLETAGFLVVLCATFAPGVASSLGDAPMLLAAGRLTLAALLLGTVGGFGSLFSLLISPEIRAYNRLCAFIAFFSWVGLGVTLDAFLRARARRPGLRVWTAGVMATALIVGLWDQAPAAEPLNRGYGAAHEELAGLRWFVESLENNLAPGALVFQLPVTSYLSDNGHEQMLPYDHIKPYVVSRLAHWSYPALSNVDVRWQQAVGRLPAPDLVGAIAAEHFTVMVIDRYGYADHAESLLADLGAKTAPAAVMAESGRYIALDIARLPSTSTSAPWLPKRTAAFLPETTDRPACADTRGPVTELMIDGIGTSQAPWPDGVVPVPHGRDVTIHGWALDTSEPGTRLAGDVDLVIDGEVFATLYGIDRSDIAARFSDQRLRASGFLVKVPSARLSRGTHVLATRALSSDRRCVLRGPETRLTLQ